MIITKIANRQFFLLKMHENIKLFKALGEETRYRIIEVLLQEEVCACKIPELIGRTQSNTSMHLSKLKDLDIIQYRKQGNRIIYSIKDERVFDFFRALNYCKK